MIIIVAKLPVYSKLQLSAPETLQLVTFCSLPFPCSLIYSHLGQMSTIVDPRLLSKIVFDFPVRYDIKPYTSVKNMFRPLVKAAHVLRDVDLHNKVAVVTGANSGLGEFIKVYLHVYATGVRSRKLLLYQYNVLC